MKRNFHIVPSVDEADRVHAAVVTARLKQGSSWSWERLKLIHAGVNRRDKDGDKDDNGAEDRIVYFEGGPTTVANMCRAEDLLVTEVKVCAVDWTGVPAMALDAFVVERSEETPVSGRNSESAGGPAPVSPQFLTDDMSTAKDLLSRLETHTARARETHKHLVSCLPMLEEMSEGPIQHLLGETAELQAGAGPQVSQLLTMMKEAADSTAFK